MTDVEKVLPALSRSKFRGRFRLKAKDIAYINEKGIEKISSHARDFVNQRIAPAQPNNDGKQTPMKGHPVFIAQHATATCCRSCLQRWHKIAKGVELTEEQIEYTVSVIMKWIEMQI